MGDSQKVILLGITHILLGCISFRGGKIDKIFCMVLQPIMHGLKAQKRLALSLHMEAAKRS